MEFDFQKLDPYEFERFVQSPVRVIQGVGSIYLGKRPDGGREATFFGEAPYPSANQT